MDVIGDAVLWNDSDEDGNVRSECEEYADTAKAYRIYHALCKMCMKLIVKYFFVTDILFLWGVILVLETFISLGRLVLFWGTSWIRVVMHSSTYGIKLYNKSKK